MRPVSRRQVRALAFLFEYFEGDLPVGQLIRPGELRSKAGQLGYEWERLESGLGELISSGIAEGKSFTGDSGMARPAVLRLSNASVQAAHAAAIRLGRWEDVMLTRKEEWWDEEYRSFLVHRLYHATKASGVVIAAQARVQPTSLAKDHELPEQEVRKAGQYLVHTGLAKWASSDLLMATTGLVEYVETLGGTSDVVLVAAGGSSHAPTADEIFAGVRARVDEQIQDWSIGEKLGKALEHCSSDDPEDWSLAVTSCRRALKDLADAVFPPRTEPVNGHPVGPENYVNRLWAHVGEKIGSETRRALVLARLEGLGKQIDAVYAMTSKGVHTEISKADAQRTVLETYLVIADILGS